MTVNCFGCGKELEGRSRLCVAGDEGTCNMGRACLGKLFCSYECQNRCFLNHNYQLVTIWKEVRGGQVLSEEDAEAQDAVEAVERLVDANKPYELDVLRRMWEGTPHG